MQNTFPKHAETSVTNPERLVDPVLQQYAGEVCITVLNWNRCADLLRLLESLHDALPLRLGDELALVVVDNGSDDDSVDQVERRFPTVEVVRNATNLGGSGGFNTAIRHALANGYRFIWMLDNDVVVKPGALEALLQAMLSDDAVAMVGSKILHAHDTAVICEAGAKISPFTTGTVPVKWNQMNHADQGWVDVDYVAACSLLARLDAVREVGLLDQSYFLLWDDMDWGIRFKRKGYRVVASLASEVIHPGFSERTITHAFLYYAARNHLHFIDKNYRGLRRRFYLAYVAGIHRSHQELLGGEARFDQVRNATRRGVEDFFATRMGKYVDSDVAPGEPEIFERDGSDVVPKGRAFLFVDAPVDVVKSVVSAMAHDDLQITLTGAADRAALFRDFDYVVYRSGVLGLFRYLWDLKQRQIDYVLRFDSARRARQHFLTDQLVIDRSGRIIGLINRSRRRFFSIWARDAYLRFTGFTLGFLDAVVRSRQASSVTQD